MSAAYITYLGGENENTRENTLKDWCTALRIEDFNIKTFLANEA